MTISEKTRQRVQEQAQNRCGYCLVESQYIYDTLEVEHIRPKGLGGTDEEDNLWLACSRCNRYKSNQIQAIDPLTQNIVALFNPRYQVWHEHFERGDDSATIFGITPCGRATVGALRFNLDSSLQFRRFLVSVNAYPPKLSK
jgi:hypothetical protein